MDSVNTVLDVITPTLMVHGTDTAHVSESEAAQTGLTAEQLEKVKLREKARTEKNFKLADSIRRELEEQGILLEDTKDGVRWKILPPEKQKE